MSAVFAMARIVVVDGIRRRALIGLVSLASFCLAGGFFYIDFIPRYFAQASIDFVLSIIYASGMVFLLFHAVQLVSWDEERKVIHTFLTRPVSRSAYILGVFGGCMFLLLALYVILGLVGLVAIKVISISVDPRHTFNIDLLSYCLGLLFSYHGQAMILAIIMFFSGLLRSGHAVLLVTISYLLISNGLPIVRAETMKNLAEIGAGEGGTGLLTMLSAIFPDFSKWDLKNIIASDFHFVAESAIHLVFSYVYCVISVFLACLFYDVRDLK
jgi:ABC-type transport system involved in multi-copper enzyme maturation permease subunit